MSIIFDMPVARYVIKVDEKLYFGKRSGKNMVVM